MSNYPKTIAKLKETDFETLHSMWQHARKSHCGKDSSSTGGKIFMTEMGTEFTYSDLCRELSKIAERFDGWLLNQDAPKPKSQLITSNEMIIGRKNLTDTKRLQNKVSTATFDRLNDFFVGIQKHDIPKILGLIIEKGLDFYQGCQISYEAEKKEIIR